MTIMQDTTDALSVELPFTLSAAAPNNGFAVTLQGTGGAAPNGTARNTWYYNETSAGSGTLVWNT